MAIIVWPNANFSGRKTVLAKNDRRLIFIQSPAAFIFCRVKSDIKFARLLRAIDSSVSLCLPALSVIIAWIGHFSPATSFHLHQWCQHWSKEERWLMTLFFSLFHKSSDYRLIGNETGSHPRNLISEGISFPRNDRSIKESDVLQLLLRCFGSCF